MLAAVLLLIILFLLSCKNLIRWFIQKRMLGCKFAPGPVPLPILGNLHLFRNHASPFQAFTELSKEYGDIFSITLGSTPCVVINTFPNMRVILNVKGCQFDDRPDFIRFHRLFGGDRGNSLALCNWSDVQRTRRALAKRYCSPRLAVLANRLEEVADKEFDIFLTELGKMDSLNNIEFKPLMMALCANIFCHYMSSVRFEYSDPKFQNMVYLFDEIFWEINQGYAIDFLPWLLPFYKRHLDRLTDWSAQIRFFIMNYIVSDHMKNKYWQNEQPKDFTAALLKYLEKDPNLTWNHIMYELEDFIGGHSAIGNLVMLALGYIVKNPEVGERIQEEVDSISCNGKRSFSFKDKRAMPYTEATMWETLRMSSSPIVPHVASRNTSIGDYTIEKGTVVFLNNYVLNTSSSCWEEPQAFRPQRFFQEDGSVTKPGFFIPFSSGKRVCIGQTMVQALTFQILARLLQKFNVTGDASEIIHSPACVALPPKTYRITLTPRG